MMRGRAYSLVLALALAAGASVVARAQTQGVIELFTSQGCSSCPAADGLMGELAKDPSLIVLSVPIDYWDYLGWKDTLAKARHTARQRGYAKMRGDREVYTPQVVVNGIAHALGSDKDAIARAVHDTKSKADILTLPVKLAVTGDKVRVLIPDAPTSSGGEVWLCPISRAVPVTIGRGENNGRTITYHNVIRRWIKLGDWTGASRTFSVPASDFGSDDADAIAVIVQSGTIERPGSMLGAAFAGLH